MNALVVCECSGRVKKALRDRGHNAYSCDIKPSEIIDDRYHVQADIRHFIPHLINLGIDIDLLIAFPDCTDLCVSGARWWPQKQEQQKKAIEFVLWIASLPIAKIAIENPIGKLSTAWRKPDQIIQPWWFGDNESKATCLWLKGLPKLHPTKQVMPIFQSVHREPPGIDRWKNRSRTFQGIANAMAEQWG